MQMFYRPEVESSGLPYNPFKASCVPRPIGWMSTVDANGVPNLAPYSQFQNVTWDPPTISVAVNCQPDGRPKDTAANAMATGELGWSMATERHFDEIVMTNHDLPPAVSEFDYAGLESVPSTLIKAPLVAGAPVQFECKLQQSIFLPGATPESSTYLLIAQVIGIHIDENFLTDGMLDIEKMRPLARLGYLDFTVVEKTVHPPTASMRTPESIAFMSE
ncbi:flavin reductase family protein [Rhodococcus sp. TAF43]|uniref:flavin reductase family protein n=1 Tax=Rhodococcus sp. TAF43 TaxID=3237483 RepID=UPI003F9914A5